MTPCKDKNNKSDKGFIACEYPITVSTSMGSHIHLCALDRDHGFNRHECWHGISYSSEGEILFVSEDLTV